MDRETVQPNRRFYRYRGAGMGSDAPKKFAGQSVSARSAVDPDPLPEYRRGHGALYATVHHGRVSIGRLRRAVAGRRVADGRLMLAVDVSNWLRPSAAAGIGGGALVGLESMISTVLSGLSDDLKANTPVRSSPSFR